MIPRRGSFVSRSIALILLAAVAGLCWGVFVQPAIVWWMDWREVRENLAEQVDHLTLVAGRRAGIEASLRQLNAALSDPAVFWRGQSGPAVSAAIQARLREVVTASGGSLRSTADLPAAPEHGLSRVTLRLQADGTVPALQAILYSIDRSQPALYIDDISISAPDGGVTAIDQAPMLSIELDVTCYSLTP